MTIDNIYLSIIVPAYNSGTFIIRSLDTIENFIKSLAYSTELIVVDDGSTDNTFTVVKEWMDRPKSYYARLIGLHKNLGKGGGVAKGILEAKGKYRVFLDADLAYEPPQILRIVATLEDGNDVATACRVDADSRYTISPAFFHYLYTRHMASRLINWILRHTVIPHCRDSQAGLKGFTADAAKMIFSRLKIFGFPFDIEVLFLAEKMGLHSREVAIEHRYFSEPTTVVFMQDGVSIGSSVLKIWYNYLLGRYSLPVKDGKKKLIINADDYGMTLPVSKGILRTIEAGTVRSTSVMTNSPEFEASMDELARLNPHPEVGLHATLTWGRPLSHLKDIPTLVDKNGRFLSRNKLLLRSLLGKISPHDVYKEMHAQCKRLSKRYPDISHIDGHHHVHVFPVIRKATEAVAREFGIKFVRSPREGLWSPWYKACVRRLMIGMLSSSKPTYWRSRGFATSDHFGGYSLSGGSGLKKRWLGTLAILPNGTTEIMVHPGYCSENKDTYNEGRKDEVAVLTDPEVVAKIVHPV
ncbi:MAG: hypothetical protein COV46_01580 [Deltaproteobacteria bacterium CG11_big_fil_rev_8_21_14_0_20_49_13]|nr:MAG: hypothetical protein COV46_01580 [Deltaproteobacteria bacterium CG11_big_fil_rev_8_21_14_0_20_49_13]